jgi:hypothetical protein
MARRPGGCAIPAAVFVLAMAASCHPGRPDTGDPVYELPPEVMVEVAANPDNPLSALVTVTSDEDGEVWFQYGEGTRLQHTTPTWDLVAGEPTTTLILGLREDRGHIIFPRVRSDRGSWPLPTHDFITEPLPDAWPRCELVYRDEPDSIGDDEVFCTNAEAGEQSIYFCVDRDGEPVWGMAHPQGEGVHAFRVLADGSFAMASDTRSMLALAEVTGAPGMAWTSSWLEGRTRFAHHWIDNHEVIQLSEGQWAGAIAFLTQAFEEPEGGETVHAPGIVVMDPTSGEVLWDWSAAGPDLDDGVSIDPSLPMERSGLYTEQGHWIHANALLHRVEDEREQFWMSMRHQDWVAAIEVADDSVAWRLGHEGDFELVDGLDSTSPQPQDATGWFFQAHAPEWLEQQGDRTRFLIFDNGIVRPGSDPHATPYSRVVEYTIDTSTMQAQRGFTYGSSDPSSPDWFHSSGTGDADMARNGTRVHIVKGYDEYEPPFLAEISYPEGELLWKLSCPDQTELYRLNWAPSLYELGWRHDR